MKKVLLYYLKPYYYRMSIGFIIKFTGTIMDLLLPWILAYLIDSVVPQNSKEKIFFWSFIMLICSICAISFNIIANRMASKVARETTRTVRHDLMQKISYLSMQKTDEFTKSSLISRLTTDTYNLHHAIGMMQRLGVRAPIIVIGGIIITFTIDKALALVLVSVMPLIIIISLFVSKKSIPLYSKLQKSIDQLVRIVREDVEGIRVIKALSKENKEKEKFDNINKILIADEKKSSITMATVSPLMNLILNFGLVIVVLVGAYRVNGGISQVGKIIAFTNYFTIILLAMINVSSLFVIFTKATASANRIMEVMDTQDVMKIEKQYKDINKNGSFIEFRDVTFSYGDSKEPDVKNISFQINKGEALGIIGATGSGKSTIINLLMRFYDPQKGIIFINGKDIRTIETKELREYFGVVFQNDILFQDSIQENINFGRGLSKEQIMEATFYARAKEFVEDEKRGYDNEISIRGGNLSGGQKQRLLIARALAAHPEILVLDDSSSALDYKTDSDLRHEIKKHFKGTTSIIIAQRISSIIHAKKIIVLDKGKIIGYGSHEELLKTCDIYNEICKLQMG